MLIAAPYRFALHGPDFTLGVPLAHGDDPGRRNAATMGRYPSGDAPWRNPITGIVGCCARVASGHAVAAPPSRVMKSRRLMGRPS